MIAATTAIAVVLLGFLVHQRTSDSQQRTAAHAADAHLVDAFEDHASGVGSDLLVNPRDLPEPLRETVTRRPVRAPYLQDADGHRGPVMWAARRDGDDVLAVRRSYEPQTKALGDLDGVLLGSGAAAGVLGCALGVVVAAAAGRRIGASARSARPIAGGDLTARMDPGGKDEIAGLGQAVNAMADALSARREAERRVTADIAQELRTPVAGLVTAVGLLPPVRPTDLVRGGVEQLRRLVEDVLEVARLDVPGVERAHREEVALGEVARRAAAATHETVEVRVRSEAVVATDGRRVERILAKLMANAHRHGAPPVIVEVDHTAIRVRDHGPGFPDELLAEGPCRFRTGARERGTGIGLGLTIFMGQAQVLDARVT
ncbi:ATP-binding protein [Streptomyces sp. NPDC085466]|uniref:HAMP domain-containing sensor histidine kinase n=1 Tax=Streptomyces sp. NPDC085466 TaxID=3365725 RepID=UPI0037CEB022